MTEKVFNPEFNRFCLKWATPIPGNTTVYGGSIRTSSEAARKQLHVLKAELFEQLLLFGGVNFSINGPNTIIPILYRSMNTKALDALLEQQALSFTVWTPQPMMAHDQGRVKATFVGRIGDGNDSELDIEKIIDIGLEVQSVGMIDSYKKELRKKLISAHTLLDSNLPATAWDVAGQALTAGELEGMGLSKRSTIIESPTCDGERLNEIAESITAYRYILDHGMISQNNAGTFDCFRFGAEQIKETSSSTNAFSVISNFEKFPNLRALYDKVDKPLQVAASFRSTNTANRFRDWLSTVAESPSDAALIREYVDACAQRKGLFDSAPAKFLKVTTMVAVGSLLVPGAELLGAVAGAALGPVTDAAAKMVAGKSAELGLGVIDSFLIDSLKRGWSPKAYFDRLRRYQSQS
ncbi:hypothetical protein SAMN05518849_1011107 [Sphingobium sp. AP50]|uniref:hypothetical protein n=1 Tax=Sphingobium sp. AP50 TaxID=1884369 RepID=UPI0008D33FD6|nr:hypothetical protein [Sphingobium sp. AP50]SEI85014.1 hypothetical protein SAMN05518849_1011107 [Sphingobium sp. AP50]